MGLVLNPYAYRIGHVNSWSDSWYLISAEYSEFLHSSTMLKSFVYYVLYKFYPTRFSYWLISHIEILFFNNNMYIWLYLYEASGKFKITKHIRLFKYGLFKDFWLKSYWLKKQLFDKNPVALTIFTFLRLFGSHIEKYGSVENYVFENEIRNKIVSLRKRYGRKWLGVEEICIMRTALSYFLKSINRFALLNLSKVIQSFLILPYRKGNLNINRLRGPRTFIFFFSYFMFLLKQWPYYKSRANHFGSKIIFVFLRQTVFFLFFNPFINYLSKFLEYLCSFFGYSSVVRASIITNFSLSAFFIARYIMTAIKNGFNYWDILFPIRKTLGRFMQIKLFDNYIKKQIPLKTTYIKGAIAARVKRINLLTSFIVFLKSKLIYDDIYKSSYAYNGYYKIFSFSSFVREKNNNFFGFFSHKNYIIKRFFCNIFKKKLFEFLANRLTFERVNEIRRLSRKPITLLQRDKYNKRRRMKRLEKRSSIDLAEQREAFVELYDEVNNRLSYIRSFSHKFITAKRSLMVVRRSNQKFFRSYNISNKKKVSKYTINFIRFTFFFKFYVIFFIAKIFKSVRLIINKKLKSKNIKYIYIFKKKKGSKKKQLFRVDKKFFVRMRFRLIYRLKTLLLRLVYNKVSLESFSLLLLRRYLLKKWFIFLGMFNRFIFSRYINRDFMSKKRINIGNFKKKLVRFYHSSSFVFDRIIDILISLSKNDHKIDKRHRRFTYGSILKKMRIDQYKNRSISFKNMPSNILSRMFKDPKKKDKLNILNNILRDIDIIFVLVKRINLVTSNNKLLDKTFFILKFYEVCYYLLILKSFGVNHYKIDNLFIIVKQFFFSKMSKLNYQFFFFLSRALNITKYFIIKCIRLYITTFLSVKRTRFVMFNFIIKIINFFVNKGLKAYVFDNYFLFLIRSILSNFKNINDLNNIYIIRLLAILDNYWYLGYKLHKRRKQKFFSEFFNKFSLIFSFVILIFKLLFTSFKYDNSYFYVVYKLLLQFVPPKFQADSLGYTDEFLFYLLNTYSKYEFKLFKKVYSYSAFESFSHYEMLITNFNFIGKESFSAFINGHYFFRTFPINISNYFNYFNVLIDSFGQTLTLHTKLISNKLLPYGDKIIRNKARDHVKSFLYGFKFHFVGRFTRKQQSASMWFRQGFLPSSSMKAEVDYGIFTIPLRFSACTVKVWLYKGFYAPKRLFTYGKWL